MDIKYVYQRTEPSLYTVGYYDPSGQWHPDSDHDDRDKVGERVHYLNGGFELDSMMKAISTQNGIITELTTKMTNIMNMLQTVQVIDVSKLPQG